MSLAKEITELRKSGCISAAYDKGFEYIKEHSDDDYLRSAVGWVLYAQIKAIVDDAKTHSASDVTVSQLLRQKLREYASLKLPRPDLLFSLILVQLLQLPTELVAKLSFFPKFFMWAGIQCFRAEDFQEQAAQDGKKYESLVEKTARTVGKLSKGLTEKDGNDVLDIKRFAIGLIDVATSEASLQKPELLRYYKASLLGALGSFGEAKALLIPFVRKKRNDFWPWVALAEVVEVNAPSQAITLYAKACLSCHDEAFAIKSFEKLGHLATQQNNMALAKWATGRAFSIRDQKGWSIPPLLNQLVAQDWFKDENIAVCSKKDLLQLVAQAEEFIQADLPLYDANYICSFVNKRGKTLVKFGAVINGQSQELVTGEKELPAGFDAVPGAPVTIAVDVEGDRPKIASIVNRQSAQPFDGMQSVSGLFRLHPRGFGFIDDVHVPNGLASQIEDGEKVSVAVVRKLDKRKNRWGLTAIAIV